MTTPAMLAPIPAGQPASPQVQVAIKNMATNNVFYFAANFDFEALFAADGALERSAFIETWKSIDDRKELFGTVSDLPPGSADIDQVTAKFKDNNVFFIARRPVPNAEGQEVVYFSMRTVDWNGFLGGTDIQARSECLQDLSQDGECLVWTVGQASFGEYSSRAVNVMLFGL